AHNERQTPSVPVSHRDMTESWKILNLYRCAMTLTLGRQIRHDPVWPDRHQVKGTRDDKRAEAHRAPRHPRARHGDLSRYDAEAAEPELNNADDGMATWRDDRQRDALRNPRNHLKNLC